MTLKRLAFDTDTAFEGLHRQCAYREIRTWLGELLREAVTETLDATDSATQSNRAGRGQVLTHITTELDRLLEPNNDR